MFNKPWTFKEGFLIGGGLILAGLALQLSVGPVVWDVFAWPVNGIVLAAFLGLIALIYLFRKKVYAFQFLGTNRAAIPAIAYGVVLTIIMGLTRQQEGGTWLNDMLSFWPFVLVYVYIDFILGLVILRQIRKVITSASRSTLYSSLLSHMGFFLALTTATLGNADMQRLQMWTTNNPDIANLMARAEAFHQQERFAMDESGNLHELPLAIELKRFIMETYDDGTTPRRYASEVMIYSKSSSQQYAATIDVNKPADVDGWKIYQKDFRQTEMGDDCQISILELVSDPWLPWVYAGIYMMLAGAVLMTLIVLIKRLKKATKKALWGYFALFVFASLFAYFFFNSYNTKTLMPALQSPWFAPHVFVYIFAYSLLGVAVIIAWWKLADDLVHVSLAFLTIGMLFGALWAKEVWGHYWSWDPKETWAAITWLSYLVFIHYRQLPRHRERLALWVLIISFVLLQMCWWGINYLPSAQGMSVHTYNMGN